MFPQFCPLPSTPITSRKVERLQVLEEEMAQANAEYIQAVNRASKCYPSVEGGPGIDDALHQRACTPKYARC